MILKGKSVLTATLTVTVLVILGKLLGFGRETLIAAYYGASADTDAFFFAQSMPGMIFPSICNSFATAFVPLYVHKVVKEGSCAGFIYASEMLNATTLMGLLLGTIGVIILPFLVPLLAPGFSESQLRLSVYLARLTMGGFFLLMLQYMLSAILNSNHCYNQPQLAALLYNISIILQIIYLGSSSSMDKLTLVVLFGLILQVFGLMWFSRKYVKINFKIRNIIGKDFSQLVKLAFPILLGSSLIQINTIVDKALGSTLPEGSLSALSYSNSLTALVSSVFIATLSTVLYPTMVTNIITKNFSQLFKSINLSLSGLSLVLIPISFVSFISAKNVVTVVFGRGNFDKVAIAYTSLVLMCYAPMFVFNGIREVLTRVFFALNDTKTPMINSSAGIICNIVLSIVLVRLFGIGGIALGTTISSVIIALLLMYNIKTRLPDLALKRYFKSLLRQFMSGVVAAIVVYAFHEAFPLKGAWLNFCIDTLVIFCCYFSFLFIVGAEEVESVKLLIKTKCIQLRSKF